LSFSFNREGRLFSSNTHGRPTASILDQGVGTVFLLVGPLLVEIGLAFPLDGRRSSVPVVVFCKNLLAEKSDGPKLGWLIEGKNEHILTEPNARATSSRRSAIAASIASYGRVEKIQPRCPHCGVGAL
jgi:hypothetical protein